MPEMSGGELVLYPVRKTSLQRFLTHACYWLAAVSASCDLLESDLDPTPFHLQEDFCHERHSC